MLSSKENFRILYTGLNTPGNLFSEISHYTEDCPLNIKSIFNSVIEKIVSSAKMKLPICGHKKLKWINDYSIFVKREPSNIFIIILVEFYNAHKIDQFIRNLEILLGNALLLKNGPFSEYSTFIKMMIEYISRKECRGLSDKIRSTNNFFELELNKNRIKTFSDSDLIVNKCEKAGVSIERIKNSIIDSTRVLLNNIEDLKTLEISSLMLQNNVHLFRKKIRRLRESENKKSLFPYSLLLSTLIISIILMIIKK